MKNQIAKGTLRESCSMLRPTIKFLLFSSLYAHGHTHIQISIVGPRTVHSLILDMQGHIDGDITSTLRFPNPQSPKQAKRALNQVEVQNTACARSPFIAKSLGGWTWLFVNNAVVPICVACIKKSGCKGHFLSLEFFSFGLM